MSTIATALKHAQENDLVVELLVETHWIAGKVSVVDGFGVLIDREPTGQSVVRLESIAAVNIGVTVEVPEPQEFIQQRQMAVVR